MKKIAEIRWRASASKSTRAFRCGNCDDGGEREEKCGTGTERENGTVQEGDLFLMMFPLPSSLPASSTSSPRFHFSRHFEQQVSRAGWRSDSRSPTQLGYGRRSYPLKWMEIGAGKKEWEWWRLQVAVPSNFAESDAWSRWRIAPLPRNVFAFKLWFRPFLL